MDDMEGELKAAKKAKDESDKALKEKIREIRDTS